MGKIDITQKINVYEVDDEEVATGKTVELGVNSHWNYDDFVVLEFGGKKLTVDADNLMAAIQNATNTGGI